MDLSEPTDVRNVTLSVTHGLGIYPKDGWFSASMLSLLYQEDKLCWSKRYIFVNEALTFPCDHVFEAIEG
jgi:hypothetical protein